MSRWISVLGVVALFGAGCGVPEEYEAEDAISQEVQDEAALQQEQQPGDFALAVTCQQGSKIGTCYDWGSGCFENSACGAGCKSYNNWKCDLYKVTISSKVYYYRSNCAATATISCGGNLGTQCSPTCS